MANYRNIRTTFWTDPKVTDDFSPEDRYVYLYMLTNPHTNLCGCYEVSIRQIARDTGYNEEAVKTVLRRLDERHNVVRYSSATQELLLLNWHRYNWANSSKLDKPLLAEIQNVRCDQFREYLAGLYSDRDTVDEPYEHGRTRRSGKPSKSASVPASPEDCQPTTPEKRVRHRYGQYGWVRLTDEEYERLKRDLGAEELQRCITYIDESAQSNGNKNKWKDWNLVIRKAHREGWGRGRGTYPRRSAGSDTMDSLQALHRQFEEEGL